MKESYRTFSSSISINAPFRLIFRFELPAIWAITRAPVSAHNFFVAMRSTPKQTHSFTNWCCSRGFLIMYSHFLLSAPARLLPLPGSLLFCVSAVIVSNHSHIYFSFCNSTKSALAFLLHYFARHFDGLPFSSVPQASNRFAISWLLACHVCFIMALM